MTSRTHITKLRPDVLNIIISFVEDRFKIIDAIVILTYANPKFARLSFTNKLLQILDLYLTHADPKFARLSMEEKLPEIRNCRIIGLPDIVSRYYPGFEDTRKLIANEEIRARRALTGLYNGTDIRCSGTNREGMRCRINTEAIWERYRMDDYARRPEDIKRNIARRKEELPSLLLLKRCGRCKFHADWPDKVWVRDRIARDYPEV